MRPIFLWLSSLFIFGSIQVFAQSTLHWVGGSGDWTSSGYNWEDVNGTPSAWQNGRSANFEQGDMSMTVDGTFTVWLLQIEDNTTFTGGTLSPRYLTIVNDGGSSGPVIFNTNLTGSDLERDDQAGLFSSLRLFGSGNHFTGDVTLNSGYTTLAGSSGALDVDGNLYVGGTSSSTSPWFTSYGGGETTIGGNLELGLSWRGGELYLNDAGTTVDVTGHLWAGRTSDATTYISVADDADITIGTTLSIGDLAGSTGTLAVSGSGSSVHANGIVWVGWAGNGTSNVTGGASLTTNQHVFVAQESSGVGTLFVSGTDSRVTADSFIWTCLAPGASSTVTVSDGGLIESGQTFSIADVEETTGSLTISGYSAIARSGTAFYLGYEGAATTTISDGGTLQAGSFLSLATFSGSSSVLNLNTGGTLIAGGTDGIRTGDGTATFNLGGGTIQVRDGESGGTLSTNAPMTLSNSSTIDTGNGGATFSGILSGSGNLSKSGSGTLTLSAGNSYSGTTTINAGTLQIDGSLASSTVSVESGAILAGSGTLTGTVTIEDGGTIAPGNSPGTLSTGNLTMTAGGIYLWEINDALGAMGQDPGWDVIDISGELSITADSGNPFTIQITSLDLASDAGVIANFDNTSSYSWTIAFASSGISGFNQNKFTLDASSFLNDLGTNGFSLQVNGNALELLYGPVSAVPEPETWTALLGLLALLIARRRRSKVGT